MICSDPICEFHLQLLIHWELLYFRVFRCVSKTRTFSNNFRRFLSIHVIKIYVAEFSNISKAQIASRCQLYSRDGLISDALKNINHIDFSNFLLFLILILLLIKTLKQQSGSLAALSCPTDFDTHHVSIHKTRALSREAVDDEQIRKS